MRRILFTGSPDWDDTRAISQLMTVLRPNRDILHCDLGSGAGRIAYRMGEASAFRVCDEQEYAGPPQGTYYDAVYDYWPMADDDATIGGRRFGVWTSTFSRRRPRPTPEPTEAPPENP